jgi:hypothetical protein
MKGTIASLVLLALELTICLVSPNWRQVNVSDAQICFKPFLIQFNVEPSEHHQLHVGPLFSTRINRMDNIPEHFQSNHAQTATAFLIAGIVLIVVSAITLSAIQFCADKSMFHRYRRWLHLGNVILLTISLIVLIVGFYSLQHILQQPLNGRAALGFFIGILFIVALGTHSAMMFWSCTEKYEVKVIEEMK